MNQPTTKQNIVEKIQVSVQIIFVIALTIITHVVAYATILGFVDGSIFSQVCTYDYHDGLVIGDAMAILTILVDIGVVFGVIWYALTPKQKEI